MAVVEGVLVASALVAVRGVWGYIYSNEEEVVRYIATVLPVLAISNFMDGMQGVLSGQSKLINYKTRVFHMIDFILSSLYNKIFESTIQNLDKNHRGQSKISYQFSIFGGKLYHLWCENDLGATRGCAMQKVGLYVNLGAYYIIGLPLAVLLTFLLHQNGKVPNYHTKILVVNLNRLWI